MVGSWSTSRAPLALTDPVIRGLSACIPAYLWQNSYGTRGPTPAIENGTGGLAFFSTAEVGEHGDHAVMLRARLHGQRMRRHDLPEEERQGNRTLVA